jgi:phosphonatase-like hydrolase
MGQSKIEVFTAMLGSRELAQAANVEFEDAYLKLVESDGLDEIPGAEALLISLREKGFKTALTTGFSRPTLDAILDSLGWRDLVDTTVVPGDVGVGRPSPLMLEAAASSLGVEDRSSCVVVGDTGSDMQAAVAFGAGTRVGVLSGAHGREFLLQKGATAVLYSVADLPNLLFN